VWQARLLLALVCAVLLTPAAVATLRRGWSAGSRRDSRIMALALGAGILELLARVVPTDTPPNWAREIFTQLLDFGHLTAASIWVGGLVALTVLAVSVRGVNVEAPSLWGSLLKRFSVIATACVGAMVLTGLWTYWIHVGPPKFLVHTLYGETLLFKLALVAGLLALGAVNQMWLLPRVQALRAGAGDGSEGRIMRATLGHFRKVVALEAAVGLAILFVVPQLASSARNQAFQQAGGGLTAFAHTDAGTLSVRRSGLEPGLTDYDIRAPGGGTRPVRVSFTLPQRSLAPISVAATQVGDGHYRVTGIDTPIAGTWRTTIAQAGGPTAHVALPVSAVPGEAAKAPQPGIKVSTWIWGLGWVLAVVIALGGASVASRQQIRRHQRTLAAA
jgi:putative copper export protein